MENASAAVKKSELEMMERYRMSFVVIESASMRWENIRLNPSSY